MDAAVQAQEKRADEIKILFTIFSAKPVQLQTRGAAETQLERLQIYYESFVDHHKKIQRTYPNNLEHPYFSSTIRDEVEDAFWTIKGQFAEFINVKRANELVNTAAAAVAAPLLPNPQGNTSANKHLPKIEISIFTGKYDEWENFRDMFRSVVHTNESINVIDKFHYLRTFVKGKALELIKGFTITNANYAPAWQTLTDYYEDRRRIVHAHLTDFFASKNMKAESAASFSNLQTELFMPINALQLLGRPTDQWGDIIVFVAVSRFEENTLREWHKYLASIPIPEGQRPEPPTIEQLKTFLAKQLNLCEAFEAKLKSQPSSHVKKNHSLNSHQVHTNKDESSSRQCPFCSECHSPFKCDVLKPKTAHERYELVRSKNVCVNCFGKHIVKNCTSKFTCSKCKKRHHTLLHFDSTKTSHQNVISVSALDNDENKQDKIESHHTKATDLPISNGGVLLATALIILSNGDGRKVQARALIDPCSQASFISTDVMQRLRLKARKINLPIMGTGGEVVATARKAACVTINSRISDFSCTIETLVLNKVTSYVPPV